MQTDSTTKKHHLPILMSFARKSEIRPFFSNNEVIIYDPTTQTSTLEAGLMGTRSLKYSATPKIGGGGYTADYKNAIDDSKWV